MKNNKVTGDLGEKFAKEYLLNLGYEILETNWRAGRFGEIDIIARDGLQTVFVEVKTRKSLNFGHPFEAIGYHKLKNLFTAALTYMQNKRGRFRIDVIGVILKNPPEIEHLKNVSLN